eukprot:CAMPEP_0175328390 /NCGR_PEP_ID=MMETSP0093-20121207/75526_1 /TAXON_ID=311494 /ORGANISM="Alexandrium monilatum, Strain CCMP3105" /LENGTH=154 /DNA_ID=CAMNT_0016625429 /DNA_START=1 /DNA_END=462 /DNA_ORIENTATION=+
MEYVHDFIQWIFPTDEASKFNRHAPLLTADVVDVFLRDPEIRANLRRSFRRFLAFLGLEIRATAQPMTVDKAKNFNRRVPTCWQAFGFMGNHNWLRISRVLHCLGMVQMEEEQQAFNCCSRTGTPWTMPFCIGGTAPGDAAPGGGRATPAPASA